MGYLTLLIYFLLDCAVVAFSLYFRCIQYKTFRSFHFSRYIRHTYILTTHRFRRRRSGAHRRLRDPAMAVTRLRRWSATPLRLMAFMIPKSLAQG